MADTPNYGWTYPTVGADADTWGSILDTMAVDIDASLKTVSDASLPKAGGTMTGDLTGHDGGVWASTGIQNLTSLGIGFSGAPSTIVDVRAAANAGVLSQIQNTSAGAGATVRNRVSNGTYVVDMGIGGTGMTGPTAFYGPNLASLATDASNGLNVGTSSAAPLRVYLGGNYHSQFATDASLLVGTTTPAGTGGIGTSGNIVCGGAITAVGNITAFVSDDRLKDREGPITGALDMVKSLNGFYYRLNQKGQEVTKEDDRLRIGLSAQDVLKVAPENIRLAPADPEFMTTNPADLVPVLIEAIKELAAKVGA